MKPDFNKLLETKGLSIDLLRMLVLVDNMGSPIRAAKGNKARAVQYAQQIDELEALLGCDLSKPEDGSLVLNDNGTALATAVRAYFKGLLQTKGLSIDRLRTLVEVDDAGSLIGAARGDAVRAGQYSRQISELEIHFGYILTKRVDHSLVLNGNGSALAAVAREFLRCLEDFAYIRRGGRNCVYNIGAGESFLKWVVVPGLSGLANIKNLAKDAHPSFRLYNLQNSDIVLGLENRTLDFGLIRLESWRKPLAKERLGPVSYCLCVPREMLATPAKPDLETLLTTLPLAVHLETAYIQGEFESYVRGKGFRPNIRLRCDTFPTALEALQTRAYATLMIVIPGLLKLPPDVVVFPLRFLQHARRDIYLAWVPRSEKIRTEMGNIKNALVSRFSWQDH